MTISQKLEMRETESAANCGGRGPKIQTETLPNRPIEIIARGEPRRSWTLEPKREIVAESLGTELTPTGETAPSGPPARAGGMIEIMLPSGAWLRVDAEVDGRAPRRVLEALGRR